LELLGRRFRWAMASQVAPWGVVAMFPLLLAHSLLHVSHPLAAYGYLAWPAVFAIHFWVLHRGETETPAGLGVAHAIGWWWLALIAVFLPESLPLERRRRQPIGDVLAVYWRLARDRSYMGHALSGALVFAGLLAYIAGSPVVFIEQFHVSPERYGLFFGTNAFGIIAASQINRWLATRVDARRIVSVVLLVAMTAGVTLLVDAYSGFGGFAGILVPLFCFIACHGFVLPNTTALAMAPHGQVAGSASAFLGTLQFVLGATAGSLVGAFANGTPVPLAAVVAGCSATAFLMNRLVSN